LRGILFCRNHLSKQVKFTYSRSVFGQAEPGIGKKLRVEC
jgi:hypothetical protein